MKTYISDNFPLKQLECQYFDICKCYNPEICFYNQPCEGQVIIENRWAPIRETLRACLESYIEKENLRVQIKLILEE
ncbi:MAG: hypothetical protein IMZ51_03955 [Chloroflexi bacterium]|nr:hypothetical protein [Chloroflexota bacterium]